MASDLASAGRRARQALGIEPDSFMFTFFGYLYEGKGPRSKLLILVGVAYLGTLAATLTALVMLEETLLLAIVPPVLLAAVLIFYAPGVVPAPAPFFMPSVTIPTFSTPAPLAASITLMMSP